MQKNTIVRIGTILAGSLLGTTLAFAATDYSAMTNEELAAKRSTMQSATVEERNAFQNEWQARVQKMSPEERQQAVARQAATPQDGSGQKQQGKGSGQRLQDGSGGGSGRGMGGGRR